MYLRYFAWQFIGKSAANDMQWNWEVRAKPIDPNTTGKLLNPKYLEGINPIALLRSVSKHFQKILFINEKIENGLNITESLKLLKPPIFFLYLNQFKKHVNCWKSRICYKAIERIFDAERLCKLNSKIAKNSNNRRFDK